MSLKRSGKSQNIIDKIALIFICSVAIAMIFSTLYGFIINIFN